MAGAGAIDFGATLSGQGLTAEDTVGWEWLAFSGTVDASFLLRVRLAGFTGLHAAVVRDEGMSTPAGHHPVFRHLLGVSSTAPGIDRGAGGVEPAALSNDQSLPVVFDVTADAWRHGIALWRGVRLMDP